MGGIALECDERDETPTLKEHARCQNSALELARGGESS
jgi:hypothetical protein